MSKFLHNVLVLNIFLQPIHFLLSISTNLLNLLVLRSRPLRRSTCSEYFSAYAVFSIIDTCFVCPTQILRAFAFDLSEKGVFCQICFYFLFLVPFEAKSMLVLASFDRFVSSSKFRILKSRNNVRATRFSIFFATVFIGILMTPIFWIYRLDENEEICFFRDALWIRCYVFFQMSIYYFVMPFSMVFLGVLTIFNIRRKSRRLRTCRFSIQNRRTEGQLVRMLFLQIAVHLIFSLPFGVVYAINVARPSTRTQTALAFRHLFILWQQCDYFLSFFLYIFSANIYRNEFWKIVRQFRNRNQLSWNSLSFNRYELVTAEQTPIRSSTNLNSDATPRISFEQNK